MININNLVNQIKFYSFLKRKFNQKNDQVKNDNLILIEYFKYKASFIPFIYFANILKKKHRSNLILYLPSFPSKKFLLSLFFEKIFFFSLLNLYKIVGVKDIILPKINNCDKEFFKIYSKLKSKNDILKITINNILIGDLIYDEYLRSNDYVTVDLKSDKFKNHLKKSISLYFFWKNFLKKNNVKSIINSHNTYLIGLMPRICVFNKIPVYKVGPSNAYKTNSKNLYTFDDRKNFKKNFKLLPKKIKSKYLKLSEKNLLIQFLGQKPNESFIKKIIQKKKINKKKILIASHCFNDAVHIYGNFIFNDFHEWIEYLASFSRKSDYQWYIKIHPSEYDRNILKVESYKKKFSNLIVLPKNFSNKQVLKLGISAVLTVYGTVGREYPIFNIPVINASKNNPHSEYNFNFHIGSQKEYAKILRRVNNLKINPYKCRENILKYYSLKYSNYNIIDDFRAAILKVRYKKNGKTFKEEIENNIFKNWIEKFTYERDEQIKKDISKFINSKQIRMLADNTSKHSIYLDI